MVERSSLVYKLLALSHGINNSLSVAGQKITQVWSDKRIASSLALMGV